MFSMYVDVEVCVCVCLVTIYMDVYVRMSVFTLIYFRYSITEI